MSANRKSTAKKKEKLKDGYAVGHHASRYTNPIITTPVESGLKESIQ